MIKNKVVLITGASSGIGAAIAQELSEAGAKVVLGARRADRLEQLAASLPGEVLVHPVDVTDRDAMRRFANAARARFGAVDVIVNNAGLMPLSRVDALKFDEWDRMIDVNIRGVLNGVAAVLPEMVTAGKGQIINIASIASLHVFPMATVYCATKYAVHAICEGLRQEHNNLRISCIYPGVVESELAEHITDPDAIEAMRLFRQTALKPAAIARAVRYAIDQPDDVDVNDIVVRPTAAT